MQPDSAGILLMIWDNTFAIYCQFNRVIIMNSPIYHRLIALKLNSMKILNFKFHLFSMSYHNNVSSTLFVNKL